MFNKLKHKGKSELALSNPLLQKKLKANYINI